MTDNEMMPTYKRLKGNETPERETSVYYMENVPQLPQDWTWPTWWIIGLEEMKGHCIWCGNKLTGRKRKYCSEDCKWSYTSSAANYDLAVTSLRRYVHKWYNFECNNCGEHLSRITPAGLEYPVHSGEVDHIIPLFQGGEDIFENLQLLDPDCHTEKSAKEMREYHEKKKYKSQENQIQIDLET